MSKLNYDVLWPLPHDQPTINNIREDNKRPFQTSKPTTELQIMVWHQACVISRFEFSKECHHSENYGTEFVEIVFLNITEKGQEQEVGKKRYQFKVDRSFGVSQDLKKDVYPCGHKKQSNRVRIILSSTVEKHLGVSYFLLHKQSIAQTKREYIQPGEPEKFNLQYESKKVSRREPIKENRVRKNINAENSLEEDRSHEYFKKGQFKPKEVAHSSKQGCDLIDDDFEEQQIVKKIEFKPLEWDERRQKILDDATPQWIEMQRNYEIKAGLPYECRITSKIREKPFKPDEKVFIMVNQHFYDMRLTSDALRMGLDRVMEIEEGVLVVTQAAFILKEDRQLLPGVSYVNDDYISDCLAQWKKLEITPYLIPLEPAGN